MPQRGKNEGFQFLDDFVCEAIPSPTLLPISPNKQGQIQGKQGFPDTSVDAVADATKPAGKASDADHPLVAEFVNGVLVIHSPRSMLSKQDGQWLLQVVQEREAKAILLNLTGVDSVSSSFIDSLLELHRQLRSTEITIKACNLNKQILEQFSLLNLGHVLTIYGSQRQALQPD